jgi:hypothetical protein
MSAADARVVCLAETLPTRLLLTTNTDFKITQDPAMKDVGEGSKELLQ